MFKLIELLATLATIASVGNFSILNNALYGILWGLLSATLWSIIALYSRLYGLLILQIILTIQYIAGVIK